MHWLISMKLLQGPSHDKVQALVSGVRTARTCLKAVGSEKVLFSGCFNIELLVDKLAKSTQSRWFYYQAKHPKQSKREAFAGGSERMPTQHKLEAHTC